MAIRKLKTSFSITSVARKMVYAIKDKYGVSRSIVVELAIRKLAEAENIIVPESEETQVLHESEATQQEQGKVN